MRFLKSVKKVLKCIFKQKMFLSLSVAKNKKNMKTNFEFYLYPENKIYLSELDDQELKQFINYLKGTK